MATPPRDAEIPPPFPSGPRTVRELDDWITSISTYTHEKGFNVFSTMLLFCIYEQKSVIDQMGAIQILMNSRPDDRPLWHLNRGWYIEEFRPYLRLIMGNSRRGRDGDIRGLAIEPESKTIRDLYTVGKQGIAMVYNADPICRNAMLWFLKNPYMPHREYARRPIRQAYSHFLELILGPNPNANSKIGDRTVPFAAILMFVASFPDTRWYVMDRYQEILGVLNLTENELMDKPLGFIEYNILRPAIENLKVKYFYFRWYSEAGLSHPDMQNP